MSPSDHIDAKLLGDLQELAAISLSVEESEALREKLQRVVELLSEIDAVEIPEPDSWDPRARLRPDERKASLDHDMVLENAPQREGAFFRVLPVLPPQSERDADEESPS